CPARTLNPSEMNVVDEPLAFCFLVVKLAIVMMQCLRITAGVCIGMTQPSARNCFINLNVLQ
ncbi:hypothetical protein L9F63_022887, partial [Diploptera punctata]